MVPFRDFWAARAKEDLPLAVDTEELDYPYVMQRSYM